MTVLVVGGTGTVGSRVVAGLRARGAAVRVAARTDPGDPDWVRFDWADPGTFGAADGVARAFLVAPVGVAEPAPLVGPFLARARLERAVLLGSSSVPEAGAGMGLLYRLLRERVRYATVLRPSWFLQNFLGDHPVAVGIRERGEIVSATGSGRIGFVDAGDVAAVGVHALLDDPPRPGELLLTGPAALSYDEAAALLTEALGRPVRHRSVAPEAFAHRAVEAGTAPAFAAFLAGLERGIAAGAEDRTTTTVTEITGRPARSFREVLL